MNRLRVLWRGRWMPVVLVALALLSGLVLRAAHDSRSEWASAEAQEQQGHLELAIVHYRRAARWYVPLDPMPRMALEALMRIGRDADARSDGELALSSFRSVHAAIQSTRSFYMPNRDLLRAADTRIAYWMVKNGRSSGFENESAAELEARYLADLSRDRDPNLFWYFVSLGGFAGLLLTVRRFAREGTLPDGSLSMPVLRTTVLYCGASLLLFALGLLKA